MLCDLREIRFPLQVSVSYSRKYKHFLKSLQKYKLLEENIKGRKEQMEGRSSRRKLTKKERSVWEGRRGGDRKCLLIK